ncbi:glycosyltransferase family 4 protein [Autumnicola musiva]|uniref:Glycosyltransferase family 4 protein n=1 Tax=Autumnicola musiva TaxID=3075589 RepID=A0ABU3D7X2_9FLAO|nr:glycosyltransferase family 4 protein [Zunongwangia sp. F117]MDT0677465.1 glycosyltransferase family 4 protein [Zunongwangia sp. F117]
MKILILINSLGAGGAERSMVEFAKFLHKREETTVKFLCLERRKIGLEEEVASFGIPIHYFQGAGGFKGKAGFVNNCINKENPDIIHSALTQANLVLRYVRLKNKKGKVIQSLVNTPYSLERKKDSDLPWQKFQLAKQMDVWSARLTSGIFYHAITNKVLQHYKPLFKIRNNYKIIYRGRYKNKYVEEAEKRKQFTIVNVGRQEFAKGQLDILKALDYLRSSYGFTKVNLEILGRPGQYSERLLSYIKENNLEEQVKIHGFVHDVEKRLVTSHAFVFPSYYEGLGGALIEAFSAKLPCICSNIEVLEEVVGNKKGALFSKPGDHVQLAENILRLYKDENMRKKLSNYSFKRFQEAFVMESINNQMLNMYKEVIAS